MTQAALLHAIQVRNQVNSGMVGRSWIQEQVCKLAQENVWTDAQIGAIVNYTPGAVRRIVAKRNARTSEPPEGGVLVAPALDIMLALTGKLEKEHRANLLAEAIKTGTSTKLISRVCDIPLGSVLYQQRRLKKELNDGIAPQPRLPDHLPRLQWDGFPSDEA